MFSNACTDCQGCDTKPHTIATLLELNGGQVSGDQGVANPGSTFRVGDSVRTDAHSSAKLQLPDGSQLIVQPSTTIRFTSDEGGEPHIDLTTGEALVIAGKSELHLHTHVGLAVLRPGTSMRLTRQGAAIQLRLEVGAATFRRTSGETLQIAQGEGLQLEIGKAVIRDPRQAAAVLPPPSAASALRVQVPQPGVRSRDSDGGAWKALTVGEHELAPNSALAVPEAGQVTLARDEDRVKLYGAAEYRVGDGDTLVRAERGKLHIHARSRTVEIAVPGGWIVARAAHGGSDAEVTLGERTGELAVSGGDVSWRNANGERSIAPGKPWTWEHTAQVRSASAAAAIESSEPPAQGHASLNVRAGESFVLHVPDLPVVVEIDFARVCEGDGVIALNGGKRVHGLGRTKVALNTDARSYDVRCVTTRGALGPPQARASVRVLRDAGTRELPPRAPRSTVEADGRSYTVHYQNQMPDILLRWPEAPKATAYQLDVDGKAMSLTAPEHEFASGSLRDGTHKLTFSAAGRRTRTTSVDIHFDNTATTASLAAPTNRGFSAGDTVEIEGVALPAWKVSVDGGTIEKVGEDRFHGKVVTSDMNPDVAVRLAHPRLGTHYYVRRAAESP